MIRRGWIVMLPLAAGLGCLTDKAATTLVPADPFHQEVVTAPRNRAAFAPASVEVARRVEDLGQKILLANKQAAVRPLFRTIGAPQPEIFHIGTSELDITEGLVNQCRTEGELAALVASELGKMVSEREALAGPRARTPEREPPAEVRIGNDFAGALGSADQTRLAELGKFEKERRRPEAASPPPPPDPQALARGYLVKAGYAEKDLEAVKPLLQAAAANSTFEKQMVSGSPAHP
jgi:hypothetical protein